MVGFAESSSSKGAGCAGSAAFGESRVAPMRSKRPSALSQVAKLVESIAEMSNFETSGDCCELSQQSSFVGITLWNLLTHWVAEVVKTFEGWKIETLDEFRYATQCARGLLQKKTVAKNRNSLSLFMD